MTFDKPFHFVDGWVVSMYGSLVTGGYAQRFTFAITEADA